MEVVFESNKVIVPKGTPKPLAQYKGSSFSQSEYLVYREDQARLRYLLKFSFPAWSVVHKSNYIYSYSTLYLEHSANVEQMIFLLFR